MNLYDIVAPLTIEEAKTDYQKKCARDKKEKELGENAWNDGSNSWTSDQDQWAKESAETVVALTGVDEDGLVGPDSTSPVGGHVDEARLQVGDPVIVTAPNAYEGKTGEISEFSPSGKFVIVNLYNHGEHSMHLSDVEYNQYADDEDADEYGEYEDDIAEGDKITLNPIMKEGDDHDDLDAVVFSRIDSEKKRLADLKKNNPEAYAREMAKEKSRSRIPPVSTFEEDSNSRYNIIRTNGHGKKDVFAGNYSLEQAKDELAKCLAHLLHTKYGHKFEIVKRDQQGVAEGKKAQDLSIYCKNLVAEMGWKSAYKHALMMANMGRDPSWNGVLRCLDAMKKGVKEASTVDGQRQDPKSSVWKQTSMSREAAVAEYGSQRVRSGGKNRMGQEIIQVLVPLG